MPAGEGKRNRMRIFIFLCIIRFEALLFWVCRFVSIDSVLILFLYNYSSEEELYLLVCALEGVAFSTWSTVLAK